jgi:hypothetical protein
MLVPEPGQIVHLEDIEGQLVVQTVNCSSLTVNLASRYGEPRFFRDIPVADLLPGEDLSAG